MADTFDIAKQPSPAGIGKPGSGSYGEGAALDRLKAQLPEVAPGAGPTADRPAPMPLPVPNQAPTSPPGVPGALFDPTARPDVPVSTPLAGFGQAPVSPVAAAATQRQRNMAVLDALVSDPNVSEVTREWAQTLIDRMVKASAR